MDGSGEENIGYVPPSAFGWSVFVVVGTFPVASLEWNVGIVGIGFFILYDEDVIVTAGVGLSFVVGVEGAVGIGSCFSFGERERTIDKLYVHVCK